VSEPREIRLLLSMIDQAYDRRSWHGTNLRGSLRGVTPRQAAWRPAPARHNIWELAVHAAYWKYIVWRRLTRASRATFTLDGSNWFRRPAAGQADESAWRQDLALLGEAHDALRDAVAGLRPAELTRRCLGSRDSSFSLVTGAAAHDVYHAGQIQLLKRLSRMQD
jgi:hypothetical protein